MSDFHGGTTAPEAPATNGFSFDNSMRNASMAANPLLGGKLPKFTKTGTTIVGLVYKDGVVLGADTRATEGDTVADKNCDKIHYIAVRPAPPPAARGRRGDT